MKRIDITPGFVWFLAVLYWLDTLNVFWHLLAAILLHELGHLALILLFGGTVRSVRLRFADMEIKTAPMRYGQELFTALAGPAVNLICFALVRGRYPGFAAVSLLLGLFNLLPVSPLDGGKILFDLLSLMVSQTVAETVCQSVSLFFIICLLALSLAAIFYWQAGLWPLLCVLMLFARLALENRGEMG